jgi:hypothetical protein
MQFAMGDSNTLAGGAVVSNVLTGKRYERAPADCRGSVFVCGSAAGLTVEVNVNGVSVSEPMVVGAQARIPVIPDDVTIPDFEAPEGALIQITLRNTTASTSLTAYWKVFLDVI